MNDTMIFSNIIQISDDISIVKKCNIVQH